MATLVLGWKALPPRHQLTWSYTSTALLVKDHAADALDVSVDGIRVIEPCTIQLNLKNTGKAALASSAFDQGRGLIYEINGAQLCRILADTESRQPRLDVEDQVIRVGPDLLEAGERWRVSFLCDGQPKIRLIKSYLPSFKIRGPESVRRKERRAAVAVPAAFCAAIILMLIGVRVFDHGTYSAEQGVSCSQLLQEGNIERWTAESDAIRAAQIDTSVVEIGGLMVVRKAKGLSAKDIDDSVLATCRANGRANVQDVVESVVFQS